MTTTHKPTKTIKTMTDATGLAIPVKLIPKIDLEADKVARKVLASAKTLQDRIIEFKQAALDSCDGWYEQLLSQLNSTGKDMASRKGNYTLYSFDRSVKIEVRIGTRLEFDTTVDIAKEKIDQYLELITKDTNPEIGVIVKHAFSTVRGKLDVKKILQLFTLQIKHPLWAEAMELLKSSIKTNITKRYIAIFERTEEGEYKPVVLQISNL